jgi:lipopolysaccharide transport protein LptA
MGSNFKVGRTEERTCPTPVPVIVILLVSLFFFAVPQTLLSASDETVSTVLGTDLLQITADRSGTIDIANSSMEYTGNVKITFGETVITADNVKIFFKKDSDAGLSLSQDSLERIVASGNVRIDSEDGIATGEKAVYDSPSDSLVITGNPATFVDAALTLSVPEITVKGIQQPDSNSDRTILDK